MEKKAYHIGDVLTITTDRLLSNRGVESYYDILGFMTGDDVFTHQVPRMTKECRPHLIKQFPVLDSPEMQFAVAELVEILKTPSGKGEPKKLLLGWLSKLTSGQYGIKVDEMLEVEKLPDDAHEFIDPESELAEKIHPDRIIRIG